MDISTDINNLLIKFTNQVMDIARKRYEELPEQKQKTLMDTYIAHRMDHDLFPLPHLEYKSFEHYLSNTLMKKKEHNFRKWLEGQGFKTKKTGAGQFKVVS